ncbi:MAG TPA: ergothioneine biosynthesis protein EgtB, partial [Phycisphaerae bacterium]|nr:ergothioneine biosynthesis protein EgtB [Phycisphaerae bacterium]
MGSLRDRYRQIREFTERLCEPLQTEDYVIQSMPDASPIRWHIAHTTWFFETFVLSPGMKGYSIFNPHFVALFNSYYNAVGSQFPRPRRGMLSRPTVAEIFAYRAHVNHGIESVLEDPSSLDMKAAGLIEIGLQHEQQHQELMLTDIKHAFSCNPLRPVYREVSPTQSSAPAQGWGDFDEGLYRIGSDGEAFCFDNEGPRHRVFVEPFQLANRPVTNGEFLEFMKEGGYEKPEFWLSEGWNAVVEQGWKHPLYWSRDDGGWMHFTLSGVRPLDPDEPVCHVSFFEADAFARWWGARLPTEEEWEIAAAHAEPRGNFVEDGQCHPHPAGDEGTAPFRQLFGDVWEWTASQYRPYPGYRVPAGAVGEYNGKFMCNQFVLRGGSCATSESHIRATYRNFFPPA